ncbi:hypothetical protein GQF01_32200 [Paenibacillus sp. 5J-6]|uniref:WD40 repeat domain-containing protein n=1 Tax=Paenibacillus silvestris TaxID=2606219 RepID=A0A6L8VC47_9BACL|nr:hypothetical protein [Paenibacillus silvestris]MZQ86780.1 hypothetical protein [Paenibacillus silvestris]
MSRRQLVVITILFLVTILLTGCSTRTRSDTIIIPDTEESSTLKGEHGVYDVKTIYRMLSKTSEQGTPLGWSSPTSVLTLFEGHEKLPSLDRVDAPYEEHLKLLSIEAKSIYMSLSPNGQSIAYAKQQTNGTIGLNLTTITDQKELVITAIAIDQIRSLKLGWSNNSRYLVYIMNKPENEGAIIGVYDMMEHRMKSYWYDGWNQADIIDSIQLADDAQSMAIVRSSGKQFYVEIDTWNGNAANRQYEHLAANDSQIEWIHNDQIAFIGQENTLYAYERRNAALSVLVEGVNMFRLSTDRKSIAFSQNKDTVYAASLYGNNVLNKTQLFKGVVPSFIAWSSDNRRLLLSGWKPYEWDKPHTVPAPAPEPATRSSSAQEAAAATKVNQNLVIEFK